MSVYSFQLRGLAEGVTIRKQEEMWDLMGLGVSGSIIDQKKKNKNDGCRPEADGLSQGRKKKKKKSETSNPCLEGTQLSKRKEKPCQKECVINTQ